MQVTLSQSHVRRLARGFAKIIPGRGSVMPVLDQVRFRRVSESGAEATATTMDETLTLQLPGTVTPDSGPDAFLCPFAEFRNLSRDLGAGDAVLLQSLPGEPPRLEVIARIEGRDIRSRIETIPPSEFPADGPAATLVTVDVAAFLHAYRTALPFVSEDPNRSPIDGVFWHEEEHSIVATDGRRLTLLKLPQFSLGRDLIIPATKVLANSILDGGEGRIGVAMEGERASLEVACGAWRYRVRSVDAVYPNYSIVIPSDVGQFVATVDIAPQDLALVRSAVSRFANDRTVAVCLCGVPGVAPYLADTIPEADGSHAHVQLPNSRYTGEKPQGQAVNGQYLVECLEAGFLSLRLPSDCSSWLCAGERPGVHCLMPMREDTDSIIASVTANLNPEGHQTRDSSSQTTPTPAAEPATPAESAAAPETGATVPDTEKPPATGTAVPQLTVITGDPLQDLRNAVTETEEILRQAAGCVRSLREKTRAVERFIRDREKQYARSEKVLVQLKEVVGF